MAAEFKIGRLRFTWVGAWQPTQTYARDSVTQYQGKTYVCLVPNTSSTNFYNDLNASPYPYWNLVVDGKTFIGNWSPSTSYSLGNLVIFGGKVFQCITAHTSTAFASDTANWTEYSEFTAWHPLWTVNTTYGINDVVRWGGIVYECIANHTSAATLNLGLEANQSAWKVFYSGVDYRGNWVSSHRYKLNDIVKLDVDLYICTQYHNSVSTFDPTKWALWMPGIDNFTSWNVGTTYQVGDTVSYGGYDYVNNTTNNTGNVPSTDSTDWKLLNTGYEIKSDWNSSTSYKIGDVVRQNGQLFEAVADGTGSNPTAFFVSTFYNATGSTGTTLKVNSTTGIVTGMNVIGAGFTQGQSVISVTDGFTVVLSYPPDGTLTNAEPLSFVGVNYSAWKLIVPGQYWTKTWLVNTPYSVGDIAVWKNTTYVCVQSHTSSSNSRPDLDVNNTNWVIYVAHFRKNAMNTLGDLEYYSSSTSSYTALPIGQSTYVLKTVNNTPAWSNINVVPQVYYVCSQTGQDIPTYGTTWDQPWRTIQYATTTVGAGALYPISSTLLKLNKTWLATEMYQWMLYQKSNNITPFSSSSTFDQTKTIRDAGFVIDAMIYDMTRGGNSQTVAAALAYFAFGQTNQFFDTGVQSEISFFIASLNYLLSLMQNAVTGTSPSASYQALNNVPASSIVYQNLNSGLSITIGSNETQAGAVISGLMSIIITALTNQNTGTIPTPNSNVSGTIFVKTGTYAETLPITVPENVAIVGDELRGVIVEPAVQFVSTTNASSSSTNTFTVPSTVGLTDQMPVQFVAPNIANATGITFAGFGGITPGQTYYVVGSTITPTQFGVCASPTTPFLGSTVLNSNIISDVVNVIGLAIGASVTGAGIPTGSVITGISLASSNLVANSITINNQATATAQNISLTSIGATVGLTDSIPLSGNTMTVYAGDCLKDMFRLRNGTGLRNMTLTGLLGTLSAPDANTIQRPTGGSFAALDPGTSPNDTSAWIFRRSPYVQNVTAFGNGCAAFKIDGNLHNGGNKSMVANDFTHIVNDGIGVWCTGPSALTEVVSVFSYYGYSGYFAEAGGRIRGTNGNTSYGAYGVIAEGYDLTEAPATGTIYNQSSQVQAVVQQAYGTSSQLLRIEYQNAGSAYSTTTTNLLTYSNNFTGANWVSDGNVSFNKINVAPTGLTEAWTLIGATGGPDGSYVYQNIAIPAAGSVYTGLTATNITGTGGTGSNTPATFNVTVTSNAYIVTINNAGSGYATTNQLLISGATLGGVNSVNDCIITVTGLSGSGIQQVSVTGTVPLGSALPYTVSLYVKQGTAPSIDIYGIFSGSNTLSSSINFNFVTGALTSSSSGTATIGSTVISALTPTNYGSINQQLSTTSPTAGWYRLWFTLYDTTAQNTQLQFRIYPRGYNGTAGLSTYIYGAQVEMSRTPGSIYSNWTSGTTVSTGAVLLSNNNFYQVTAGGVTGTIAPSISSGSQTDGTATELWVGSFTPSFYLEVITNSKYTAYANYNISGSGTGAVTIGDETRSAATFQTRVVTDSNGVTGGSGYLTASNNAQFGTTQYIQLAQADTNTNGNYTGMRVFVNSGTGAGQYGYISYFNSASNSKIAYVLKESFDQLQVTSTTNSTSVFTLNNSYNTNTLYLNQPVQFIPTYYTTGVTSTGLSQTTVTAALGGTSNYFTVASTQGMYVNMPLTFSATSLSQAIFSDVTAGYTYYIYSINPTINGVPTTNTIQITEQPFGNVWNLNTVSIGSMTLNFPSNTSYLQAPTTNMVVNYTVQFTGVALGGLSNGVVYYIQDVIDYNNFTVSSSLVTVSVTASTSGSPSTLTASSTSQLVPLNPIVFTNVLSGSGIVDSQKYYISSIVDAYTFTVSTSLTTGTVTATAAISNLITVSDTTNYVQNQPIRFVGTSFEGNILPETTYYILVINSVGPNGTFTISQTPGGGAVSMQGGTGTMTAITCPAPTSISTATGTMTGTSTATKTKLSLGVGSMNATFSTSLFGGVTIGTTYYVQSIPSTTTFTVSANPGVISGTSTNQTPITILDKTGSMNLAAVGWDHLNIGTPISSNLDSSSVYYIEPRTVYTAPPFFQATATTTVNLAVNTSWVSMGYGNGIWMALPNGNSTGAYSTDGLNWTGLALPAARTWSSIAYGGGYWVIISSGSTMVGVSKSNGQGWRTYTMPSSTTWSNIAYGNGRFVAIATGTGSAAYSTNFGVTWTASSLPGSYNWTGLAWGNGLFIAIATGTNVAAYSRDGVTWISTTMPDTATWADLEYGNNIFQAVCSTSHSSAYTFDGVTWYSSNIAIAADHITYGQGVFVAVSKSSTTAWTTEGGIGWKQQLVTNDGYGCMYFGYNKVTGLGLWPSLSGQTTGSVISAGCKTKGRAQITSGTIVGITEWEPGSGYLTNFNGSFNPPSVTFVDPNVTVLGLVTARMANGVLSSPTFYNKGIGYNSSSTQVIITGNGYSDAYQTGLTIIMNNLTRLPSPGDNLTIAGVNQIFKVTSAYGVYGTAVPTLEANVSLSPNVNTSQATANGTVVSIRSKYSQVRLTNHDFLNIGYGDQAESNYPGYPQSGYVAISNNQVVEVNYGRVFFTSTDQDGNFKVGNLFGVQQATGIVTLSASQFGLTGLQTLSLGGIAVGGSSVTITQFSTDSTFTANSDTVLPTQKAIKAYLASRLSQGGANTFTGQLTAGSIVIGGPNFIRSSVANGVAGSRIQMKQKVYINGSGVDGNMAALDFFMRNATRRS